MFKLTLNFSFFASLIVLINGINPFLECIRPRNKRFKVSEEDIEEIKIQCLSPQSLIKKYSIEKVEKLMIDVEGSEYKILKSIDYKKVRINNIIFEKKHFDGTFNMGPKLKEIKDLLAANNYELFDLDEENIIAKKTS